ncbi:MAG: OmpA family protein [Proteobacteria bacterium]|nr:OmpA family protein [Pseudomonadota bacterium]MBI3497368.1 OmpA family protein [Pseudomonadota bacterium]
MPAATQTSAPPALGAGAPSTLDQVYRNQLARSAGAAPPPAQAEPPVPPTLTPPRGALTHVARGLPPGAAPLPRFTSPPPALAAAVAAGSLTAGSGDPVAIVQFASGSTRLSAADRQEIQRVVAWSRLGNGLIRLIGHAGRENVEAGREQELRLSLDRAGAVASELLRQGVAPERITATGVGAAEPLVVAGSPQAEAQNRRVEIFIIE